MNNIAHLSTAALDTAAKFFRVMEKVGADFTGPMQDPVKRNNLVTYLEHGCPKVDEMGVLANLSPSGGIKLESLILGEDFISPEEVSKAYGFTYTDEQLAYFEKTVPPFEALLWLRKNGYMLVAGPATDLDLLGVHALDRSLFKFYKKYDKRTVCWWEDDEHPFSRIDTVKGNAWLMLRKGFVPRSMNRTWDKQLKRVKHPEFVPSTAEVSYGVTVYRKVRGVNILPDFFVRTSSIDLRNHNGHIYVGHQMDFGALIIENDRPDHYREYDIGIASARR